MILSQSEIAELTARQKPSAQARELAYLGIPYRARRDGTLVVLRAHVEAGGNIRREPRLRFENVAPTKN